MEPLDTMLIETQCTVNNLKNINFVLLLYFLLVDLYHADILYEVLRIDLTVELYNLNK